MYYIQLIKFGIYLRLYYVRTTGDESNTMLILYLPAKRQESSNFKAYRVSVGFFAGPEVLNDTYRSDLTMHTGVFKRYAL